MTDEPQTQTLRDYMHASPLPVWSIVSGGRYVYIPHEPCNFRMIATNIAPDGSIMQGVPVRIFFHTKSATADGREVQDYLDLDPSMSVAEMFDHLIDLARTVAYNELQLEVKYRQQILDQQQAQRAQQPQEQTTDVADAAAEMPPIPQDAQPVPVQDWDEAEDDEGDPELAAAAQNLIDEVGEEESKAIVTNGAMVVAPPKRTRNRRR